MSAPECRAEWTDLHNHVIPGVDDGARDPSEAVAAVRSLRAQGVERVVATPHLDGSLTLDPAALDRRLTQLEQGWSWLNEALGEAAEGAGAAEAPGDTGAPGDAGAAGVGRGAEVKLDVPEVDLSDPRLRLDGGPTVLVEFPFLSVPPRSAEVLGSIVAAGYQPLLAHPERYQGVDPELAVVGSWLEAGAFLQVNAGSFIGSYGPGVMARARALLGRGWAHCVASDFHARGTPDLRRARTRIEEWAGEEGAVLLFEVNPPRLLSGQPPLPVTPARHTRSTLRRLRELLPWS